MLVQSFMWATRIMAACLFSSAELEMGTGHTENKNQPLELPLFLKHGDIPVTKEGVDTPTGRVSSDLDERYRIHATAKCPDAYVG